MPIIRILTKLIAHNINGNVTQVASTCPWLNSQTFSETFTYDASDQLVSATETQNQSYRLDVTYGNWGKINGYNLAQTDMQSRIAGAAGHPVGNNPT